MTDINYDLFANDIQPKQLLTSVDVYNQYAELDRLGMEYTRRWDLRFLNLAKEVSTWSKDPSTKVGAVIVDEWNHVVAMGYNGFPRNVADTEERLNDRPTKLRFTVHAEVNACIQAGKAAEGGTLYVYPSFVDSSLPNICNECAKVAIQSGIAGIVQFIPEKVDEGLLERWGDSIKAAGTMWSEAGLFIRGVKE